MNVVQKLRQPASVLRDHLPPREKLAELNAAGDRVREAIGRFQRVQSRIDQLEQEVFAQQAELERINLNSLPGLSAYQDAVTRRALGLATDEEVAAARHEKPLRQRIDEGRAEMAALRVSLRQVDAEVNEAKRAARDERLRYVEAVITNIHEGITQLANPRLRALLVAAYVAQRAAHDSSLGGMGGITLWPDLLAVFIPEPTDDEYERALQDAAAHLPGRFAQA